MTLAIPPELQRLIEQRMKSGRYATPEDVVTAALFSLDREESGGEFEPGELDRLLAEGEQSEPLDGDKVLEELRALRSQGRGMDR
jgi:antitoxin ParD1/3/4